MTKDVNIVMVCTKYGVAKGNFQAKPIDFVFKYPEDVALAARVRSNDGICDPWGNIWIEVMNNFPWLPRNEYAPKGVFSTLTPLTFL